MNKIRLKQPKYILPAILYFPLLGLGWLIIDIFHTEIKKNDGMETTEYLNSKLPQAYTQKMGSKRENMMNTYRGIRDYSAVQGIGRDSIVGEEFETRYSEEEVGRLQDQLDSVALATAERERAQQKKYDGVDKLDTHADDMPDLEQIQRRERESQLRMLQELERDLGTGGGDEHDRILHQLRRQYGLDPDTADVAEAGGAGAAGNGNGAAAGSDAAAAAAAGASAAASRVGSAARGAADAVRSLADDAGDNTVVKHLTRTNSHFNTLSSNERESRLIRAIIDEELKAVDGSRVRLRLLDDADVNGYRLKKGTYLYATMSGFAKQRVQGTVQSVMCGDELVKVSLSIYDTDGMKGLYVPGSSFREAAKEVAGNALQGSMNVSSDLGTTTNSVSQYAVQALQNSVQRITSTLSKAVRKNKVRLKYGTQVYLINGGRDQQQ